MLSKELFLLEARVTPDLGVQIFMPCVAVAFPWEDFSSHLGYELLKKRVHLMYFIYLYE